MAQVAQDQDLRRRIDHYLAYLQREWEHIPELAAEWDTWDELSQLDFAVEWPIREDRLHQLEQWAKQGLLTLSQHARYEALLRMVIEQRPTLQQLIGE